MSVVQFEPFPKIPRLKRTVTITEKIDGTNAQILVRPILTTGSEELDEYDIKTAYAYVRAGSRSRWIKPGTDNFGFAVWVHQNAGQLAEYLGHGQHFGEWWGQGIQRGYGLDHKRLSLFNAARWNRENPATALLATLNVHPVPTLITSELVNVDAVVAELRQYGSVAAPGYMNPEGVVVYHHAARAMFKVMCENDDKAKGEIAA